MHKVSIKRRKIGDGEPAFIIAEAGINHNGDAKIAAKLVERAAEIEADAIKFQIFKADELYAIDDSSYKLFKKLELPENVWGELRDLAKEHDIIFGASVFGTWSSDLLENIDGDFYKIASSDITNFPLLENVASKGKPIILSSGASYIGEIDEAIRVLRENGSNEIVLLHCVSSYPTDYRDVNLKVIDNLKRIFSIPVGFSDHTIGVTIPIAAVAIGANAIEKHFTLNKNMAGPDHKLSLDVREFKELIDSIRKVEMAMGDGIKRPMKSELYTRNIGRRGIYAAKIIQAGEKLDKNKIILLRPHRGIDGKFFKIILGRKVIRKINSGEPVEWSDLLGD